MAINDTNKLDILWKKYGYGMTETSFETKDATNESIPSPTIINPNSIWVDASAISIPAPTVTTPPVTVFSGSSAIVMVQDTSSTSSKTWLAMSNDSTPVLLGNWISPSYDPSYAVKVFTGSSQLMMGTTNLVLGSSQTILPGHNPDGSLNSSTLGYEYYFDYSAGVLYFPNSIPDDVTSATNLYLEGCRYTGQVGLIVPPPAINVLPPPPPVDLSSLPLTFVTNGVTKYKNGTIVLAADADLLTTTFPVQPGQPIIQILGTGPVQSNILANFAGGTAGTLSVLIDGQADGTIPLFYQMPTPVSAGALTIESNPRWPDDMPYYEVLNAVATIPAVTTPVMGSSGLILTNSSHGVHSIEAQLIFTGSTGLVTQTTLPQSPQISHVGTCYVYDTIMTPESVGLIKPSIANILIEEKLNNNHHFNSSGIAHLTGSEVVGSVTTGTSTIELSMQLSGMASETYLLNDTLEMTMYNYSWSPEINVGTPSWLNPNTPHGKFTVLETNNFDATVISQDNPPIFTKNQPPISILPTSSLTGIPNPIVYNIVNLYNGLPIACQAVCGFIANNAGQSSGTIPQLETSMTKINIMPRAGTTTIYPVTTPQIFTPDSISFINESSIPVYGFGTSGYNLSTTAYRVPFDPTFTTPGWNSKFNPHPSPWNSSQDLTQAGYTQEAVCVGGIFRCDNTDYSTGYVPLSLDYSSKPGTQYATFAFSTPYISQFKIHIQGTFTDILVYLPTTGGDIIVPPATTPSNRTLYSMKSFAPVYGAPTTGVALGKLITYDPTTGLNTGTIGKTGSYVCSLGSLNTSQTYRNLVVVSIELSAATNDAISYLAFSSVNYPDIFPLGKITS